MSTNELVLTVLSAGATADIPPRTLNERLRLAIRWCRDYHDKADDPADELAAELIRHLGHVGLKLVWTDGRELSLTVG